MNLPFILAGPILRRVEADQVSVWVALSEPATVRLSLWEGQVVAGAPNRLIEGPTPGAETLRIGDKLHVLVVTLKTSKPLEPPPPRDRIFTLLPDRTYSYNLTFVTATGAQHDLKSLGLLSNAPHNGHAHLPLGYAPDLLPSFALPPSELTNLRIVHGSCRRANANLPDGLAWVDDFILEARKDPSSFALKRPHQLFMTGDQIYADDVSRLQLSMMMDLGKTLIGTVTPGMEPVEGLTVENVRVGGKKEKRRQRFNADVNHFPPGTRDELIWDEALLTSTDGHSHLLALGEFAAMYILVWCNSCWPKSGNDFPTAEDILPPFHLFHEQPQYLNQSAISPDEKEMAKQRKQYQEDRQTALKFLETLKKVRRALANVPTYMMFDDHDVTDDWYLNPMWRDRVLTNPLGKTLVRNALLAYALFQDWGNDPVKYETGKNKELLTLTPQLFPAGAESGPDESVGNKIDTLFGLDLAGGIDATKPPITWHFSVSGPKHKIIALDNRTRRSYMTQVGPPGNVAISAQPDQIPAGPLPAGIEVLLVVAPLPVIGTPIFDELFAPLSYRAFDLFKHGKLEARAGTRGMTGTDPDAIEGWAFDAKTFEALLKRLEPYRRVVFLSGDVHHGFGTAMSYWKKGDGEPARFAQFTSSGIQNVMPWYLQFIDRTFGFAQRLLRAMNGAERLGWNETIPAPLVIPANAKLLPTLSAKLRARPVMIATEGWPEDTRINPTRLPDWQWRVNVVRDQRLNNARPKPARSEDLGVPDVTTNLEGYRRVAKRHLAELELLNNSRQLLFANNIGLVTFQKRTQTINGSPEVFMDATQTLYTTHPKADDPQKPEPYTEHVVPLRVLGEQKPQDKFQLARSLRRTKVAKQATEKAAKKAIKKGAL